MKVLESCACAVQRIPTLREYFEEIYPSEMITNIELKTSWNEYRGIEEKVLALIDEFDVREKSGFLRLIIFLHCVLSGFHRT